MLYHNQIVIAAYGLESLIDLAKSVTDAREHLFGNSLMLWDQWEGPETFLAVGCFYSRPGPPTSIVEKNVLVD